MKISFSPEIICCGWLGSKHQLTKLSGMARSGILTTISLLPCSHLVFIGTCLQEKKKEKKKKKLRLVLFVLRSNAVTVTNNGRVLKSITVAANWKRKNTLTEPSVFILLALMTCLICNSSISPTDTGGQYGIERSKSWVRQLGAE